MIVSLFVPLILFIVLACLAWLKWHGLALDRTIKISDFFGLAATTLVAVVLQHFIYKRGKATDSEKQLLTKQIVDLLDEIGLLNKSVIVTADAPLGVESSKEIIRELDQCEEQLSAFEECLKASHCKKLTKDLESVIELFYKYKKAISGNNFPASPITSSDIGRSSLDRVRMEQKLRLLCMDIGKQ